MEQQRPYRVLISGGGTGGHIFPALAIANALRRRDPATEILFVGAQGRMEMERVPAAGYDIIGLPVAGFDRHRPWRNIAVGVRLMRSMLKARRIVRQFKPDIAVGVGGYASGPVLKAAQRAGIPTLIQEQNSYAGVTNKLLAKQARMICVAYDGMGRFFPAMKVHKTGNPVRKQLMQCSLTQAEAKSHLGFDIERPLVAMVGGSLGARSMNVAMAAALRTILGHGASVLWQTGQLYYPEYSVLQDELADEVAAGHLRIVEFVEDMDILYRAADLMVSRAGAGTISELQLIGQPAVLVPSPNVAEDHQTRNAEALVQRQAAVMIPDGRLQELLAPTIAGLISDTGKLKTLSRNVKQMAMTDSDEKIVDAIYSILRNEHKTTG